MLLNEDIKDIKESILTPQLQVSTATAFARHQHEYRHISKGLPKGQIRRILSFGCSTGMEARTLAYFFKDAEIIGVDINEAALDEARRVNGKFATFLPSDRTLLSQLGQFDLVTCNSVFCRFPPEMRNGLPVGVDHAAWSDTLSLVLSLVRPGGFLQLFNSNIPFRFHPEYDAFRPVRDPVFNEACFVDLFTPEGGVMAIAKARKAPLASGFTWYAAGPAAEALEPWDLHDQVFQKAGGVPVGRFSVDVPELAPEDCDFWSAVSSRQPLAIAYSEKRPTTSVAVDVEYGIAGGTALIMQRTLRRIWFDGSEPIVLKARLEMPELEARAMLKIPRAQEDMPLGQASAG